MDDDFDDPELWAAAERAATASSASSQMKPQQHQGRQPRPQLLGKRPSSRTTTPSIPQPKPQGLDKRPPNGAISSLGAGKIVQPTPHRLDKAPPPPATAGEGRVVQPTPQALPQRSSGSSILVSPRQKGNPVLQCIKNVPWEFSDIPGDYGLGATTCALFLSLKYHRLYPEYVYGRIRNLQGKYNLRILLTMIDIANHEDPLRELAKMSLISNVTLVLCWSAAEAARYLELYKSYENASFKAIQGQQGTSYVERLIDFVTVPRGVNKSDAVSLVSNFGSLKNAINAEPEQIGVIGGWGEVKVKRWASTIDQPFRVKKAARRAIADVAATSSALVDPGLAMEPSQMPSIPATAESGSRLGLRPQQGGVPSRAIDDEEEAMMSAAIEESKKTPRQMPGSSCGPTTTPRHPRVSQREDEEEGYMLTAATATATTTTTTEESKATAQQVPATSAPPRTTNEPDALPGGIAAALARLREQG